MDEAAALPMVEQVTNMAMNWGWKIASSVAIFVIGYMLIGFLRAPMARMLERSPIDPTATKFLIDLMRWVLLAMLGVAVAGNLGVETSSFVALLGCLGLAIGMAMDGTLSNFAAGILLAVFRPFKVDDFIEVGDHEGRVQEITIVNTILITLDNETIILPNSEVAGGALVNYSTEPYVRIDIGCTVGHDADLDAVEAAFEGISSQCELVLDDPSPEFQVTGFSEWGVEVQIEAAVLGKDREDAGFQIARAMKNAMTKHGISGPYKQVKSS